jgi:hypothetical protein
MKLKPLQIKQPILALILVIIGSAWWSGTSQAANLPTQTRPQLQVSPAILEQFVTAGESSEAKITVTNLSSNAAPVVTVIKQLDLLDDAAVQDKDIFDASAWFVPKEPEFLLLAGESKQVSFQITPPKNAEAGGHYATIYFEPVVPFEALAPNTAQLTERVGSLAFVIVKGPSTVNLELSKPLSTARWRQFGPVPFEFIYKNSGTMHTLPGGSINIFDWRGQQVDELKLTPGVVMPKTSRGVKLSWDKHFLVGRYTAKLLVSYEADKPPLASSVVFWVAPVYLLVALLVLISLVGVVLYQTRGRWERAWRVLRSRNQD